MTLAMATRRILLAAAALGILQCLPACAQDPSSPPQVLAGVGGSIGSASIRSTIPIYAADPACGEFVDATAVPITPSLSLRLPSLFADGIGAGMRVGLAMQTAKFSGRPADPQRQVDPRTGELVDIDRSILLESSLSTLQLDLLAGYTLEGVSLWVGPTIGLRVAGEETVRDVISAPDFATFRDGTRERGVAGATVLTRTSAGFGGVATIAYTLGLAGRLSMSPHVGLRMEPSMPFEGIAGSQVTVTGGLDLLLDLTPSPAPPPVVVAEPEPVRPEPVRPAPVRPQPIAPRLDMRLSSLDTNGEPTGDAAEVIFRELVERRHVPLIASVFFDSASAALPARLRQFGPDTKPREMAQILAELTTMEAQAHLLNVLGERLRANPKLRVTLVGSLSAGEDRALGTRRAEAVREYLLHVWRLDPGQLNLSDDRRSIRLSSEEDAEGREENRRVEIVADPEVLRPVFVERTVERAVVPVRLQLDATSNVPATRWKVVVSDHEGQLVAFDTAYDGTQLSWPLVLDPETIPSQSSALAVTATAEVDNGVSPTNRSVIPLTWRREQTFIEGRTERNAERELTTWQVLGFGFNTSALLEQHRQDVRAIGGLVRSAARIVVTGYSDRLGDEKRNLALSQERAESVASALREELLQRGRKGVVIEALGAGVDESRFSNDLPEGRFLSRGATIVVEQAVH